MTTMDNITCGIEAAIGETKAPTMDRNRPYDGQPHTNRGVRGQQEIHGVTMRDLHDCFIRAVLRSTGGRYTDEVEKREHLDKLYEEACMGEKARLSGKDLYGFNLDLLDPIAIAQNLVCEVERIMGIFPNVDKVYSKNLVDAIMSGDKDAPETYGIPMVKLPPDTPVTH